MLSIFFGSTLHAQLCPPLRLSSVTWSAAWQCSKRYFVESSSTSSRRRSMPGACIKNELNLRFSSSHLPEFLCPFPGADCDIQQEFPASTQFNLHCPKDNFPNVAAMFWVCYIHIYVNRYTDTYLCRNEYKGFHLFQTSALYLINLN